MAKRVKLNEGDIFSIKLDENLYGIGRIYKIWKGTVFVAIYKTIQYVENSFDASLITKENIINMEWCFDTYLKKEQWSIIGNIQIEPDFVMPNFVTSNSYENKHYLIIGSDSPHGIRPDPPIEVSAEQAKHMYSDGVAMPLALVKGYIWRLKNCGLM